MNVGLDTIATGLGAGLRDAQWVANGYLVALGLSLPASGWLGRRFGVGRVWLASLAGFTVTSALCALAGGVWWLVAARVVQGLSAGVLVPAGQTILGQAIGPQRLGRVMATLGIAVTAGPALGPALGGLIVHVGSWPWLFLLNLPLGGLGIWLGWRYLLLLRGMSIAARCWSTAPTPVWVTTPFPASCPASTTARCRTSSPGSPTASPARRPAQPAPSSTVAGPAHDGGRGVVGSRAARLPTAWELARTRTIRKLY